MAGLEATVVRDYELGEKCDHCKKLFESSVDQRLLIELSHRMHYGEIGYFCSWICVRFFATKQTQADVERSV
jgi:hypothetical protein